VSTLKHIPRIVVGYLASTFVALIAGLALPWLSPGPGSSAENIVAWDFLALAGVYWLLILVLTAIPALVVVVIAEAIKLRSPVAHVLIGAFIGFLFTGQGKRISPWIDLADGPVQDTFASTILIIAGALGALAYWAVAGRYAGQWRER